MTNYKLIDRATKEVIDYYEAEGITTNTSIIFSQALNWYNNTDIADEDTLAAAVLAFGDYKAGTSYSEIEKARDFFFPSEPLYFHIGEIEAALRDLCWES